MWNILSLKLFGSTQTLLSGLNTFVVQITKAAARTNDATQSLVATNIMENDVSLLQV